LLRTNAGTIREVRFTAQPGDAVVAASRLAAVTTDVKVLRPDSEIAFSVATDGSDGELTSIYGLFVATDAADFATADRLADDGATAVRYAGVYNFNGTLATRVGIVATIPTAYSTDAIGPNITEAQILAASVMVHWEFSSTLKVRDFIIQSSPLFTGAGGGSGIIVSGEGRSYA
jgi:hypothetical protein